MPYARKIVQKSKLTFKEQYFCELFVNDKDARHNGAESAMKAYHCKDNNSASATATEVLNRPHIVEEIDKLESLRPENLTDEKIKIQIAKEALHGDSSTTRSRNLTLLAQTRGMIVEKKEISIHSQIQAVHLTANCSPSELLEILLQRLTLSSTGAAVTQQAEQSIEDAQISSE